MLQRTNKSYTTMKRLTGVLTAALLLAVMTMATGCSKEEDDKFMIDMEQVSILVGDDYTITPNGAFTARSTDEGVATVNASGVIHGVSAGEADIIFTAAGGGQAQTCKVSVDWKHKYFEEPILDFNMSLEELKARETHEILHDNLWEPWPNESPNATDPWLVRYVYNDQDIPAMVCYLFPDKKQHGLYAVSLECDLVQDRDISSKINAQLTERYGEGETDELGRTQYLSLSKGIRIRKSGRTFSYYPITGTY